MADPERPGSGRPRRAGRMLFALVWVAGVVGSLAAMWWGMYRVHPVETGPAACIVTDGMALAVGALALGTIAGIGWAIMGSGAWVAVVAAPAYVTIALLLVLPCSFLPQLALPPLSLVAVGAVFPVVRWYLAGGAGPMTASREAAGPR